MKKCIVELYLKFSAMTTTGSTATTITVTTTTTTVPIATTSSSIPTVVTLPSSIPTTATLSSFSSTDDVQEIIDEHTEDSLAIDVLDVPTRFQLFQRFII